MPGKQSNVDFICTKALMKIWIKIQASCMQDDLTSCHKLCVLPFQQVVVLHHKDVTTPNLFANLANGNEVAASMSSCMLSRRKSSDSSMARAADCCTDGSIGGHIKVERTSSNLKMSSRVANRPETGRLFLCSSGLQTTCHLYLSTHLISMLVVTLSQLNRIVSHSNQDSSNIEDVCIGEKTEEEDDEEDGKTHVTMFDCLWECKLLMSPWCSWWHCLVHSDEMSCRCHPNVGNNQ